MVNENKGKNGPKPKLELKSTGKSSIDSIDSLICGWVTHMLMRFSHAHEVILCEREGITRA
jgi:hypothetical protein